MPANGVENGQSAGGIQAKLQTGKSAGYVCWAKVFNLKQMAKTMNELGVQKLPWVKELQSEYAVFLAEKKKAYAEYQQARQEMQEVLTAKANVNRLLGTEEQDTQKEKEHGQR